MRWAPAITEPPKTDGQFYAYHPRMGKCVMGFVGGSWGGQPPDWWLMDDQCAHQGFDPMALKAYPIEDEL
jgi:hypothetical protein